jgi:hypothetical protein
MKKIRYLLIILFIPFFGFSQTQDCGLVWDITNQQLADYIDTRDDRNTWEAPEVYLKIPIQFHIVRETNGTGGLDPLELQGIINGLNSYYENANMQFYECSGVQYIDDSGNYDFWYTSGTKSSWCSANDV